jgi:hypothetical protein
VEDHVAEAPAETRFVVLVGASSQVPHARLAIESLRAFGGPLAACGVWVVHTDRIDPAQGTPLANLGASDGVNLVQLALHGPARGYLFAAKVRACAVAEALAAQAGAESLVWLSPESLIVQPPLRFLLERGVDAAFRTVHHRNIGSLARESLDPFWARIYRAVGVEEAPYTTESFADRQSLRPYYNSHCFAVRPSLGLCRAWWDLFEKLVVDKGFQQAACSDTVHRVFLHQAILSTLVVREVAHSRLCALPPGYSYPLHMHREVPDDRRARSLDELVCPVHEGELDLSDLEVSPALRTWLVARRAIAAHE